MAALAFYGHNRLAICGVHGLPFETRELEFESRDEAKEWLIHNQFGRRNIPPFLRFEYAKAVGEWDALKAKAKENLSLAGQSFSKQPFPNSEKVVEPINATKQLAARLNVGADTASRMIQIEAKAPEVVKEKLRSGEISINEAYKGVQSVANRQTRFDKLASIAAANVELNDGLGISRFVQHWTNRESIDSGYGRLWQRTATTKAAADRRRRATGRPAVWKRGATDARRRQPRSGLVSGVWARLSHGLPARRRGAVRLPFLWRPDISQPRRILDQSRSNPKNAGRFVRCPERLRRVARQREQRPARRKEV